MMLILNTKRSAFTLIELMIALGLLGALMAVAWSLLGTFRDAEIRGWKLSSRTQTIRSARAWLEDDLQHLAVIDNATTATTNAQNPRKPVRNAQAPKSSKAFHFSGNAMGFSTVIAPSIDPIPFLENLMSDTALPEQASQPEQASSLESSLLSVNPMGAESSMVAVSSSPWPAETVLIEYLLTPVLSDKDSLSGPRTGISDQTQFVLTRREMLDTNAKSVVDNPSEQVLTAQDLYRQSDQEVPLNRQPIRESRLEGLMNAQFRYFDGIAWRSEWNSVQQAGMPHAIAFGFDFPATADMKAPSETTTQPSNGDTSSPENTLDTNLPLAESGLSTEPKAEVASASDQGLMESSTNEVQIVIFVGKGSTMGKSATSPSMPRELP